MELTATQKEILFNAWVLAREGKGQVVEDWAIPDAHRLAEEGWLERRIQDDQVTWWWSDRAELALNLDALKAQQNPN